MVVGGGGGSQHGTPLVGSSLCPAWEEVSSRCNCDVHLSPGTRHSVHLPMGLGLDYCVHLPTWSSCPFTFSLTSEQMPQAGCSYKLSGV